MKHDEYVCTTPLANYETNQSHDYVNYIYKESSSAIDKETI